MNDADDALKSIEDYAALNYHGWDTYRATPISPETIARAKGLVEALRGLDCANFNPCPGADGSIVFEICWADGRELWVDIVGLEAQAYIPNPIAWQR